MTDDFEMICDWPRLYRRTISAFAWRAWVKPEITSVRPGDDQAEIRTEHTHNPVTKQSYSVDLHNWAQCFVCQVGTENALPAMEKCLYQEERVLPRKIFKAGKFSSPPPPT
jgi:hypothetical protein